MSTTTEQLVVALEARIRDFERNMAKASGTASRQFGQIERQAQQSGRRMESAMRASTANVNRIVAGMGAGLNREFSNFGRTLTAALAGAASARGAQQLLDSSTRITNALKVAGLEGERLSSVYDTLFASAQRNSAPLESLVTLYGRVAIVQNELGVSGAELLSFTDNVALALRVAGTDAQSASGALLQLSQAMGAGTVRAEEFNSILEGALPIAQAAAAGMKEAGGSVAALRALVVDGKVSSEAFFRAFEAGSVILEEKVAGAESTVSQGFVRLQNVLIDVAGRMDEGTDASDRLVGVLNALSDWIATADFSIAINGILDMGNAALQTIGHVQSLGAALGALTGADQFGEWWRDQRSGATLVRDVHAATQGSGSGDAASDAAIAAALASRGATTTPPVQLEEVVVGASVTPVSIADYPVGGPAGGGSGGRARGGGRRGGGGGRDREAAQAERQAEAVRDLITELEREQSLLSATDAQRAVSDALKRAGAAATSEQKARIEELVTAIEREKEALDGLKAAQEEMRSVASDVLGGIATGLKDGASAGELMAGVIDKLMSKLIDMAVQNLVANAFGGTGGGGLFGAIFGGAAKGFATGGHVRGPGTGTSDSIPARLSDGEFVVNAKSTKENRALLEAINRGGVPSFASGGPVGGSSYVGATTRSNTFAPTINVSVEGGSSGNPQADQEYAASIAEAVNAQMEAKFTEMLTDESRPGGTIARRSFRA